ncbi:MAG TPA: zinc ribbon domain-containing protein [Actinomycetota bacterium]|nr:zinc ribbon domain-containing protein [Actinomycetota bacterium]
MQGSSFDGARTIWHWGEGGCDMDHRETTVPLERAGDTGTCPECGRHVAADDRYCGSCGAGLIDERPVLCAECGNALSRDDSFCRSCGMPVAPSMSSAPTVATPIVPDDEVGPDVEPDSDPSAASDDVDRSIARGRTRRRRTRWIVGGAVVAILLAAGAVAAWALLRGPDLEPFDDALRSALQLASEVQVQTDDVDGPSELDAFATEVRSAQAEAEELERVPPELDSEEHVRALERVMEAHAAYLAELERLATLPSSDAVRSEYRRASELADALNEEFERAAKLREPEAAFDVVAMSPTSLTGALDQLAAYRKEILAERARIARANRRRARTLDDLRAEAASLDGIVARYSDARSDLALWIDQVDRRGATFDEAYDVLAQHGDLRSQLRDELAALTVSEPFAADQAALLGVMDTAINALGDAERGIAEYQYDYRYLYYDETPGWRAFEDATDAITDDYSAALAAYETHKDETFERLSERRPLPALPD